MKTSPIVAFGLYALSARLDSTPFCPDLQPFSKIEDLKTGNMTAQPYVTFEPDFWLLDGGYKFKPDNDAIVHVGLMSLSTSDANGVFATPPILVVDFKKTHSAAGLTIRFAQYSEDYASEIRVEFFDESGVIITSNVFYPDTWDYSTEQQVIDFKKIIITFRKTNKPNRFLRVTGIDFGKLTYFSGEDIKSASIVEEINPLSVGIPSNSFELELYSKNAQFSIINPEGLYAELQNKQPFDIYEQIGKTVLYMGQFYLEEWENVSDKEIRFHCIDRIGVLETIPHMGGMWLTETPVENVLDAMFNAISTPYDLDIDLYGKTIRGWLPVGTYRSALQQIAFAVGAYITCARSGVVQIRKTVLAKDTVSFENLLTKTSKGLDQSLTLKPMVTDVEITAHNYFVNADSSELFNEFLSAGMHVVTFNAPAHDLTITGGTIVEAGANYATVFVANEGIVTLSGQGYTETTRIQKIQNLALDPNIPRNVLSVTDATLIHSANVETVTKRVYDYYQQRYQQKVKLFSALVGVGESALIETLYGRRIKGVVEKMAIDLTGGFLAKTDIVGAVE